MKVEEITLYQVRVPLKVPYVVSTRTITEFDPIIVSVRSGDGEIGWGEALIAPGYTSETVEGAWQFCVDIAETFAGKGGVEFRAGVTERLPASPGAASALLAALDMLEHSPVLFTDKALRIPLLAPLQGHSAAEINDEVDRLIERGFATLKVKVGFDWKQDLDRVELIQRVSAGRVSLRLDANRSFREADAIAFAERLDPADIELFEQPCGSADWSANTAVAARSKVPVMLDESIYGMDDVRRAAMIEGVKFIKLKLKKIGSVDMLCAALDEIRKLGMTPVLGDGVALEIGCWMEACVAASKIDNAGEMNGFLKAQDRFFEEPLRFARGAVEIPAGFHPRINHDALAHYTTRSKRYS
ncbi:mandelate racemase/muconate lactonizing enzyme family protein [Parapusillimonas sp. JC17]|uniref:mandelate racemase/muconate lactonizing enzyme family protein n=1 Tax=Parapusillimonas sp. JC17 TaxID=3445768 RepID=UPI003FA14B98